MPRRTCPGSSKPPSGNVTGITGRCSVCRQEFLLTPKGTLRTHKEPVREPGAKEMGS